MYFCENPACANTLELRYFDGGKFELHEYGAVFWEPDLQATVEKMMEVRMQEALNDWQEPAKVFELDKHRNLK